MVADTDDAERLSLLAGSSAPAVEPDLKAEGARIGLAYFYSLRYIQRACDLMLGKKSPLCRPEEQRPEMGG